MGYREKRKIIVRPAWRNFWKGIGLCSLLLIASGYAYAAGAMGTALTTMGLALAASLFVLLERLAWKYYLFSERLTAHYGIVSRYQQTVRLMDIKTIDMSQSIMQRIFGVGDLAFYSAGSDTAEVRFIGVLRPVQWRSRIERQIDILRAREKSGEVRKNMVSTPQQQG